MSDLTMTLGDAKKTALMLLDEYTQDTPPYTQDADIAKKLNSLFNIAQFEAAQVKRIVRSFEIVQNPPLNAVPPAANPARMYSHISCDLTFSAHDPGAYHFAVDDDCVVHFERDGQPALSPLHHHAEKPGEFVRYKGVIPPSDHPQTFVLRFSGGTYYNIQDVALFAAAFASPQRIPDYQRFIPYPFPRDFAQLSKIETASNVPPLYRLTGSSLLLDAYCHGSYSVEYFAWPALITDTTPDSHPFDIAPDAALCLPYGVAADILKSDPSADYSAFEAKYAGKLANLDPRATNLVATITPVMGTLPY